MFRKAVVSFVLTTSVVAFVMAQIVGFSPSLDIRKASGYYVPEYELVVLELELEGIAGDIELAMIGELDAAGVLAYVFPTTLSPAAVGFGSAEGIVAIVVTSHPDFDDTPLFDENQDGDYNNDGAEWHSHVVMLTGDKRLTSGLAVKQFEPDDQAVVLPPTHPGLPLFLDSPGFPVILDDHTLRVLIPQSSLRGNTVFNFDAVTAYLQVNTSDELLPLLGVYEVYDVLSGDLSLPLAVEVE